MQIAKFTEEEFKAWVFSKADTYTLGLCHWGFNCPITSFLNSLGCVSTGVFVDKDGYLYYAEDSYFKDLPEWAMEIVVRVEMDVCDPEGSVTAKQLKDYYAAK